MININQEVTIKVTLQELVTLGVLIDTKIKKATDKYELEHYQDINKKLLNA